MLRKDWFLELESPRNKFSIVLRWHLPSRQTTGDGRAQSFGSFSAILKDSRAAEVTIVNVHKLLAFR
jgi:hypothetical protein